MDLILRARKQSNNKMMKSPWVKSKRKQKQKQHLCNRERHHSGEKKKTAKWEKILRHHTPNKRFLLEMLQELEKLNNEIISIVETELTSKQIYRWPSCLWMAAQSPGKCKSKSQRCPSHLLEWIIKRQETTKVCEDVGSGSPYILRRGIYISVSSRKFS